MSRSAAPLLAAAITGLGLAIGAGLGHGAAQPSGPLPPGPHMELVLGSCIICHSPEILAQQRLDRVTWETIVDRMITYGAPITRETRPLILQYLITHLGP